MNASGWFSVDSRTAMRQCTCTATLAVGSCRDRKAYRLTARRPSSSWFSDALVMAGRRARASDESP